MKHLSFIVLIVLFTCHSCTTLDIHELQNMDKIAFQPITLKPDCETNNLRIDIIRQTYESRINDSTKKTNKVSYHPIGFNLGNGLFYDLNRNLCLRIDHLKNISPDSNIIINQITRPQKNRGITTYQLKGDTLSRTWSWGKKMHYDHHCLQHDDSTFFYHHEHLKYIIADNDTAYVYAGKRRIRDIIHKVSDSLYYVNKNRPKNSFRLSKNKIHVGKDYIIKSENQNRTLSIQRHGSKKDRPLFKIERSADKIMIYNYKYYGQKIVLKDSSIYIYQNKRLFLKYQ